MKNETRLGLALASIVAAFCTGANAAPVVLANQGFESVLTGWTLSGSVVAAGEMSVVTSGSDWIIAPYQTQMAYLDGRGSFVSGLDVFFGLSAGTIDAAVAGKVFNGAGIQQSFTGHAGETVTQFWDFVARDDISHSNDSAFVVVNGQVTVLASIQDGGIEVGSYGNSDWQSFSYILPADGAYALGFGVVNTGDFSTSGALFLDNQAGRLSADAQSASTVPEPETVTLLLAGLGLLGFMTKRKNSFNM